MNLIDQAILQDEVRKALNALFANGQVGHIEPVNVLYKKVSPDVMDNASAWSVDVVLDADEYFTKGEKYAVRLDHGTYEVECKRVDVDEENGGGHFFYLGNASVCYALGAGLPVPDIDTGESFFVFVADFGLMYAFDMNKSQSIAVTSKETIHPIDPKFLPGVCLPVVEFSTTIPIDGTEIELSADDSIKLTKATESGLPVCVIGALSADGITVPISAVTALMKSGEDTSLSLMFNGRLLQFRRIDTVWTAIFGGGE